MSTAFLSALGMKIRSARTNCHLSLKDAADRTSGRIGTAQLSSYERGDRNINVENLSLLAGVYSVDTSSLIPDVTKAARTRVRIDTARLQALSPELGGSLARWVRITDVMREPYRPHLISVGEKDLENLALLHGTTTELFYQEFSRLGVLS